MLWNGLNLEQWFERFLRNLGDVPSAMLSDGVEPMGIAEGALRGQAEPPRLDVARGRRRSTSRTSARRSPGSTRRTPRLYAANADAYVAEIRAVAEPIRAELAAIPEERRWLATSEGAFSYLARDFGLHELYIWPINADQQGSPQQVRKVIDAMREHAVPAIFSESTDPGRRGRAGRPRDRREIRRRPLRRQPLRARRPGADLSRHAAGDREHHRRGAGAVNAAVNAPEIPRTPAAATAGTGLRLGDVSVTYRTGLIAIEQVSFEIPRATITALVGVNGSGKSTLFKAIMGFVPVASGSVEILDRPARAALADNLVAYVPQAEEVDWSFPVLVEDVVMMGRYGHMSWLRRPSARDRALVDAALERVGMAAFRRRQIGELSGGQRKRVFLARALAQEGQVILLDEPFTGVDVTTEEAIVRLLGELRDEGRVMLISTHNLGSVPEYLRPRDPHQPPRARQRPDRRGLHPVEPRGGLRRQAAAFRARRPGPARRRGPAGGDGADRRRAAVRHLWRQESAGGWRETGFTRNY